MSVPDCWSVSVESSPESPVLSGVYSYNDNLAVWVNQTDNTYILAQTFDANAQKLVWSFMLETPEGASSIPTGSQLKTVFPIYTDYNYAIGNYHAGEENNSGDYVGGIGGTPWDPENPLFEQWTLPGVDRLWADQGQYGLWVTNSHSVTSTMSPAPIWESMGYMYPDIQEMRQNGLPTILRHFGAPPPYYYKVLKGIHFGEFKLKATSTPYQSNDSLLKIEYEEPITSEQGDIGYIQHPAPSGPVIDFGPNGIRDYGYTINHSVRSSIAFPGYGSTTSLWGGHSSTVDFGNGGALMCPPYASISWVSHFMPDDSVAGGGSMTGDEINAVSPFILSYLQASKQPIIGFTTDPALYTTVTDPDTLRTCTRASHILDFGISSEVNNTECPSQADWSGTGISIDGGSGGSGGSGGDGGDGGSGSETEVRDSYTGNSKPGKYKGWVFDERTSAISGPFIHEDITAITTKDNSAEMYCVNSKNEVKKTNLLDFNNPNFSTPPNVFANIKTPFNGSIDEGIIMSETGKGFSYRNRYMSEPFEDPILGNGSVEMPLYFRNCYLAQTETNWIHLGDEHSEKQCYRVDLRFHKNSCGHLWLYVKNDEGLVKGQYKGEIKEHMKVFTNLRGRSFKIQMMIATHHDYPWAMREMAIGHLYGKSF